MKIFIVAGVTVLCLSLQAYTQEPVPQIENQLEDLAAGTETENEDDELLQQYELFKRSPLVLNMAAPDDLRGFHFLSPLQLHHFFQYRELTGPFVSVYELQAIPGWDPETVRRLLPFVTTGPHHNIGNDLRARIDNGNHQFVLRYANVFEITKGILNDKYAGSAARIFFRYRYQHKQNMSWGLTADKDAGEQFLRGVQRMGFDFYSFHAFIRELRGVHALALGDYTVSMGQGLIQWQSMGFRKGSMVSAIKRQGAVLKPYTSAGEHNFMRGAGLTVVKKKLEITVFGSARKLSANMVEGTEPGFSSFLASGNHRTGSEITNRHNLLQRTTGIVMRYVMRGLQVGLNHVNYHFSYPLRKEDIPYNLYAMHGRYWFNQSIDFSRTFRNVHVFGEFATDRRGALAAIAGLLATLHSNADLALLYRHVGKDYQAVNANAFMEGSTVNNETGCYTGLALRLHPAWKLDMMMDMFSFHWLRYRLDRPGFGRDYLAQLTYTPSRGIEIYTRWRSENKTSNESYEDSPMRMIAVMRKNSLRTHLNFKINADITMRHRSEFTWYDIKSNAQRGYLVYTDILYKPMMKPWGVVVRYQVFETDDYESRLYAYENDVMYGYSIPVYAGEGNRWYVSGQYDLNKRTTVWVRFARSTYDRVDQIGSGDDEIAGNTKTEIKLQVRLII